MSWFTRKNKAPVAHLEPSIRLIEPDADDLVDVTPAHDGALAGEAGEEAVQVQHTADDLETEQVSPLHVHVRIPHDVMDVDARPVEELPAPAKAEAAKAGGRFAGLAARFKRNPAVAAAPVVSASDAPAHESQAADESGHAEQLHAVSSDDESETRPAEVTETLDVPASAKAKGLKALFAQRANRAEKPKFSSVPVRVVIGFLPEVTERDALEYAVGIAEKHFEQIGMSYFDAFKYGSGYAFEAHEGGTGKAYLPEVIRYFDSKGAFRPGEEVAAVIRTATRAVEVQRTRDGLVAIILPERDDTPPSDWLEPTTSMQPAINKRTGFLVAGAALFTTGFIAVIVTSMLTRFQEYDRAPDPVLHRIEASQLPNQQWSMLASVPANSFVRALRYRNGRWESPEIVSATTVSTAPTSTTAPGGAHSATPSQAPVQAPTTAPVTPPSPGTSPAATPAPAATQGATR